MEIWRVIILNFVIGLNVVYKSVFLGVPYGSDLSKIYEGYAGVTFPENG